MVGDLVSIFECVLSIRTMYLFSIFCWYRLKRVNWLKNLFFFFVFTASKPTLKYKFIGHLLKPGPDVSLKCIASGTPTPHITWKFDGNDVPLSQM